MPLARRSAAFASAMSLLVGCASGVGKDPGGFGMFEDGGGDSTTFVTTGASTPITDGQDDDEDDAADDEPSMPPDLGMCVTDDDCLVFDAGCFENGTCVDGVCDIPPKFAGDACDDEDPCTGPDFCDGAGTCIGDPLPCEAANASGGVCMAGLCMGLSCDPGWGNCNGDWLDGCELPVVDDANCGECGIPCEAGPNSTASCNAGICEQACEAPWANCDGDWSNGCEIPEGVANQCDVNGLNSGGCWTPYCGQSDAAEAVNFGTWFCFECSTCHVPSGGSCACGGFEDNVCG
jgi:hypothetical protein